MIKKLILFIFATIALTSCGLSEEARQLEETNLELAGRLRQAESIVIPAMQDHIENLENVVDATQKLQNDIDAAHVTVDRASTDVASIIESIPAFVVTSQETVLPEELPKADEGKTFPGLLESQREDIERTHRHNSDAANMREIVNKLDEIGQSLGDAADTLEGASEYNRAITDAVSNEVVGIADTTEIIADEIAGASALADDAAARARSIRDKADVANIVGGALATIIGNIPIPGGKIITGALPSSDSVIPRTPYEIATTPASESDESGFPYWLIPVLLGGGTAPLLSKKVRGGVGKAFGRTQGTQGQVHAPPAGPGQSSDARFLGEALMRMEAQEQAERQANGSDVEARLARILEDRRRRRQVDEGNLHSITQQTASPRGITPGQSGVFSMPAERIG